jgi:hypothetical protein
MPKYYKNKHLYGDGQVFINKNSAYVNGFFHLWDFPLSKIHKISNIKNYPLNGLHIVYSYRTIYFNNYEEIFIPIPDNVDLEKLIEYMNK